VILHEFGHFIVAKAVGMRVERFALFFPPLLFRVRRGETEYGVGAIPLGGYVKISGMNPREELPPEVQPRAYYRQAPWRRIVVILAGPMMNVLIAFVILFGLFVAQGEFVADSSRVDQVSKGSPAAGILRPGDRLLAVDGRHGDLTTLRQGLASHGCAGPPVNGCEASTPAKLQIRRGDRTLQVSARPRYSKAQGRPLLGFTFGEYRPVNVVTASGDAVSGMWRVTKATVSAVAKIFYSAKARKDVHGVVGSYETTRQAINFSATDALAILALISLSLAIVNLFPFLPLDGGHVFWALAEKIRGRAIPFAVMERAGVFGFVLVGFLFIVGLSNDIGTLAGKGFGPP
jgi:regulator of sigma E protease